jgi:uncharacterized protein YkwD
MARLLVRHLLVLTVAAGTLIAAAPSHAQGFSGVLRPDRLNTRIFADSAVLPQNRLLWLINDTRVAHGLAPLIPNNEILTAASYLAGDMARNERASHTDSYGRDGGQRLVLSGYQPAAWGEIIGESWATGSPEYLWTEQDMLNWWMNSPPHRANILNPTFTEIGVGIANKTIPGSPTIYRRYWCVVFGDR